jgi:hypothetical protein
MDVSPELMTLPCENPQAFFSEATSESSMLEIQFEDPTKRRRA